MTSNPSLIRNAVGRNPNLTLAEVERIDKTDEYGIYPKTRIISNPAPVVVRQENPKGPVYQEALGYSFLLNSMKRPRITRLDSGRVIMFATAWFTEFKGGSTTERPEQTIMLFSEDDGRTWTDPRRMDMYGNLFALGGQRVLLFQGGGLWFSEDGGETWSEKEEVAKLPDGRVNILTGAVMLDKGRILFTSCTSEPGEAHWMEGELFTSGVVRCYDLASHTWGEPTYLPKEWGLCEGTVTRAANGNLVAGWRTQMIGVPIQSDHHMGLATNLSRDNGKTWSKPVQHFQFGHHHQELLTLPDGRILMTYAARIGELDGMLYHGVEAVVSKDHGETWDWDHRYILFRWHDQCTHSPQSVRLSDGRILTAFLHGESYSWTDGPEHPVRNNINLCLLGNVSVVIWRV